jgi:hypothetical protein
VQGIFSRRLRKRIDANTLTNGQTNGRTNSQAEYNAVPAKHGTGTAILLNDLIPVNSGTNSVLGLWFRGAYRWSSKWSSHRYKKYG